MSAPSNPGLRPKLRLIEGLFTYPFRPEETIASLLTDSSDNIARWDSFTSRRKFVGLAGADAHAKLALLNVDPGDNRYSLPLPGYEASFRTQSVHVNIDAPLSGNARDDAAAILRGVRSGHLYMALDAFATPPSLEFTAENGTGTRAREGDAIGRPSRRSDDTSHEEQCAGVVCDDGLAGTRTCSGAAGSRR